VSVELIKELDMHIRSRATLIYLVTTEEERITRLLLSLCEKRRLPLWSWDLADGFKSLFATSDKARPSAQLPDQALAALSGLEDEGVFLLPDFHIVMKNQPRLIRQLRNLAREFKYIKKTVIIIAPSVQIPEELKDDIVIYEAPPPGEDELEAILRSLATTPGAKMTLTKTDYHQMIRSALGLSANQAQRVFAKAVVSGGVLDKNDFVLILSEKKQIIRESGALEFITPQETMKDVGGLARLKDWLKTRGQAFSQEARRYGLPEPKGIALIGISGTGKSLTAKMIAGLWGLPLIRLDIGALFGSLVGQSEENTRRALMLAETIAPCVLWIDEIEKGLAAGGGDAGTSMRVLGSILSWMQEKKKPVFVAATANNISLLPAELLRRGRFDEIFFLDLPNTEERREIFKVHIRKRGRDPELFDLDKLAALSDDYVGAEIEQAVIDAMYIAFCDEDQPGREFNTEDVAEAVRRMVPMSRSQAETVEALRQWLREGRSKSASLPDLENTQDNVARLRIEPELEI